MTDQSKMSNQKTLKGSNSATSSQESEGGLTPSNSPGGIQTDLFGLEVAPVKVSQQQDKEKAQMTSVIYGHNGFASSESQSLQQSLASKLLERLGSGGSMQSPQTLKRVTTDLLRAYCQDTLQEPITVDKDYGSWPTPQTMDGMRGNQIRSREELSPRAKKGGCSNLRESVHTWPTPRTVDGTGGAAKLNKRGKRQSDTTGIEYGANLRDSVHTWSTPNTMDHLPLRSDEAVEKLATTHRKGRTSPANLREQVDPEFMKKWKEATWPTPRAQEPGTVSKGYGRGLKELAESSWPTPSTRDYKGGYQGGRTRNGHISTDTLDITAQLTGEQSNGSNVETAKPARSRLNPMFSLWLMGYPKSWIQKAIPENTVTQARSKE